jgi:hypothetical protein
LLDRYGGRFLYISIAAHVFFAVLATWYVVQHILPRQQNTFLPPKYSSGDKARQQEHQVKVKQKNKAASAPAQAKRITTTAISARVALPEMPMTNSNVVVSSRMAGMGGNGFAMGAMGAGGAGGGGGGGSIPLFGVHGTGHGLIGTLYDLKQGPNEKPNDMAPVGPELSSQSPARDWQNFPQMKKYCKTLSSFVRNNWSDTSLASFYRAPNRLTTTQIFIPEILAAEAPKAFSVENTVKPRRWVIHYTATIIPPRDGDFRFVGYGDDILLVRINGRDVLDGNYPDERIIPDANSKEPEDRAPDNCPFYKGSWFSLRKGSSVRMDVMIGEGPGGHLRAFLLIDEKAANNAPGDYAVFQLKDAAIPEATKQLPRGFTGKKMLFGVANASAFSGF